MNLGEKNKIDTKDPGDFLKIMQDGSWLQPEADLGSSRPDRKRIDVDQDKMKNGLGQLVLTLVKLIHELLERQAIRRIDAGSLSDNEIERVGETLMMQAEEIDKLRIAFGLEEDELNLDLGPLGKLL